MYFLRNKILLYYCYYYYFDFFVQALYFTLAVELRVQLSWDTDDNEGGYDNERHVRRSE